MKAGISNPCPMCGAVNPTPIFQGRDPDNPDSELFFVARCRRCEIVCTYPPPNDREMHRDYGPEFFKGPTAMMRKPFMLGQRLLLEERIHLVNRFSTKESLLDIGCGDGAFIETMKKKGFAEVVGVEISETAAARARSRELRVEIGRLENLSLPKNYFSTITFFHVLEHLSDPKKFIEKSRELLRPHGVLILSVPNFASLQSRLFREHWFHLDLPRHRIHFEPETLTNLLQTSGFEIIHLSQFSLEYNPYGLLQSFLNLFTKPNHLYRLLKRDEKPHAHMFSTLFSLSLSPFIVPPALLFSALSSMTGYGGTITIVARQKAS